MKRRFLTILSVLVSALCLVAGLAACGDTGGGEPERDGQYLYTLNRGGKSYTVAAAEAGEMTGEVSIPSEYKGKPVTAIRESGFAGNELLTAVTIPASVTSIGEDAFANCTALQRVTLNSGSKLKTIEDEAFIRCSSLTDITLPSGLTTIGRSAFQECGLLTDMVLPNSVTELGENAFRTCFSLQSVTLSTGLKTIETETFFECGLIAITIPASVTKICKRAFMRCYHLESVTFQQPNGWTVDGYPIDLTENASWNANYFTSMYREEDWTRK